MTVKSFLQETNKEIWRNLYTSLHSFLNLHDSEFVLKVSHFIFKSSSYLELIKSYCPVQGYLPRYVLHGSCCKIKFAVSLTSWVLWTQFGC